MLGKLCQELISIQNTLDRVEEFKVKCGQENVQLSLVLDDPTGRQVGNLVMPGGADICAKLCVDLVESLTKQEAVLKKKIVHEISGGAAFDTVADKP